MIDDCKLKTYETNGKLKKNESSTKGASLVRALVRMVQFTRYILQKLTSRLTDMIAYHVVRRR